MAESEDKIMKSFPFDSQVSYDAEGTPIYDRSVNSADLAENIALLYTNGVLTNPSTCLQVVESEAQMSVQVLPGACCINGRLGREDNTRTIVFEAASSNFDRIDRVVLRLNINVDARDIDIYVLKGNPSAAPVAPALTRTGGIYELCLADVFIPKNTQYIAASRITDTRMNEDVCGYMLTNPQSIDSSTIFNQYQAALDEFLEFANDTISGTVVGELEENFAPLYSTTTAYKVGDMVTHNAKYYVCQAATSGTWDESKWLRVNVAEQIGQINNDLSGVNNILATLDRSGEYELGCILAAEVGGLCTGYIPFFNANQYDITIVSASIRNGSNSIAISPYKSIEKDYIAIATGNTAYPGRRVTVKIRATKK